MNRKVEETFYNNLKEILENGTSTEGQKVRPVWSDGTPAHTKFINHVVTKYDISKGEFPITEARNIAWKSGIKEMFWIYQDGSNSLDILRNKYNVKFWDEWDIGDGTIGQRYGATVKKYDLMNKLLKGLKEEPYTRRHIMSLWQEDDFKETKGLNPCAFMTVWTVRGEYLDVSLHQRSSDFITAFFINETEYVALLIMVAKAVGLKAGIFTHFVDNLHIYNRHFDQAKELMRRIESMDFENGKSPQLILDTDKTDFYSFTIDDFKMVDYNPMGSIGKIELAI